jgi:hypothetical protein
MANGNGGSRVSTKVKVFAAAATTFAGFIAAALTFGSSLLDYLQSTSNVSRPSSAEQTPRTEPDQSVSWESLQSIYFEPFESRYQAGDDWWVGVDQDWEQTIGNGSYCAVSRFSYESFPRDPAPYYVSTYVWSESEKLDRAEHSNAPVSVDVYVTETVTDAEDPSGRAGLLYRYSGESGAYYSLVLSESGDVYFMLRREQGGVYVLWSGKPSEVRTDGENTLGLIGKDDTFYLYVNNSLVKVLKDGTLEEGLPGVIATNVGRFCFDNFTLYEIPKDVPR